MLDKSELVKLRVTKREKALLRSIAKADDVTMSEAVRRMILKEAKRKKVKVEAVDAT